MKKRILSVFLGMMLLMSLFPMAFAADEEPIPTSGNCGFDGADVNWSLTAPGLDGGKLGPDVEIQLTIINRTGKPIEELEYKKILLKDEWHYIDFLDQEQLGDGAQITVNFTYNQNMLYNFYAHHFPGRSTFNYVPIDVKGNSATLVLGENFTLDGFTLTISGNGLMQDYSGSQPWTDFESNITNVIIEDKVISIGDNAFANCNRLRRITISDSVKAIGSDSFWNTALTSITIPKGVIRINEDFRDVPFLTDIHVSDENQVFSSVDGVLLNKNGTTLIRCPVAKPDYTIPNSVTTIGNHAFYNCNINQIIIPDSVITIEGLAFSGCSISQIVIPDSVTTIEDNAFYNCTNLRDATISDFITSIPYGLFRDCAQLRNIKIPDGVEVIQGNAFENCTSLKEIYLPESLTRIDAAFSSCKSLENVYYAGTEADWNEIKIDSDNVELIYANRIYGPYEAPPALAVKITADTITVSAQGTVINTTDLPEEYRPYYNQWDQYQTNIPSVYAARYQADTGRMEAAFSLPYKIIKGNLRYSLDAPAGTYKVFLLSDTFQPIVSASELKIE